MPRKINPIHAALIVSFALITASLSIGATAYTGYQAQEQATEIPTAIKWDGEDLAPMFELVTRLGSDNIDMILNVETGLLWIYGPSESDSAGSAEAQRGTPFNFAHKCPPLPPEVCES